MKSVDVTKLFRAAAWIYTVAMVIGAIPFSFGGEKPMRLLLASALFALIVMVIATTWPHHSDWLLRNIAQPSFTVALAIFGYALGEFLDKHDGHLFNAAAFSLVVLAIPRQGLGREVRHQQEQRDKDVNTRIKSLESTCVGRSAGNTKPSIDKH